MLRLRKKPTAYWIPGIAEHQKMHNQNIWCVYVKWVSSACKCGPVFWCCVAWWTAYQYGWVSSREVQEMLIYFFLKQAVQFGLTVVMIWRYPCRFFKLVNTTVFHGDGVPLTSRVKAQLPAVLLALCRRMWNPWLNISQMQTLRWRQFV